MPAQEIFQPPPSLSRVFGNDACCRRLRGLGDQPIEEAGGRPVKPDPDGIGGEVRGEGHAGLGQPHPLQAVLPYGAGDGAVDAVGAQDPEGRHPALPVLPGGEPEDQMGTARVDRGQPVAEENLPASLPEPLDQPLEEAGPLYHHVRFPQGDAGRSAGGDQFKGRDAVQDDLVWGALQQSQPGRGDDEGPFGGLKGGLGLKEARGDPRPGQIVGGREAGDGCADDDGRGVHHGFQGFHGFHGFYDFFLRACLKIRS